MANKNALQRQVAPFLAVVQYTFLPEEAPKVQAYITNEKQVFEMLEILGSTGYEVSMRYDSVRDSWSVCLKGADRECLNAGKWMYGNGKSLHLAFCSALYKHFEVYEQREWIGNTSGAESLFS